MSTFSDFKFNNLYKITQFPLAQDFSKLGINIDNEEDVFKNLGTNLNNSSMETLFQHDHVSMVEFTTVPMAKLRDNVSTWSAVFAKFVHKKKVRFPSMCQHFRSIGVEVMDDLIPTFVDKKNRRRDGREHLSEMIERLGSHR